MSNEKTKPSVQLDQFFTVAEARHDRWRNLLSAARAWNAAKQQNSATEGKRDNVATSFAELRQWEDFFAYPGGRLMKILAERIAADDALSVARMLRRMSGALLSGSYRYDAAHDGRGDALRRLAGSEGAVGHR